MKKSTTLYTVVWFITIITFLILILFFISITTDCISIKIIDWAYFGTFFGSLTGLIAFAGVLYSASLSEERAEKAELEYKKNEDREFFFKSIELLKSNSDNLRQIKGLTNDDPFKEEFQKFSKYTFFYYIMNFIDKLDETKFYSFINELGSSEKETFFLEYLIRINNIPFYEDANKYNEVKTKNQIEFNKTLKYRHKSKNLCDELFNFSIDFDGWTEVLYKKVGLDLSSEDYFNILIKANLLYFYKASYQLKLFCNTYHYIIDYLYTSNLEKDKCIKILNSQITKYQLVILYVYLFKDDKNIRYISLFNEYNVFNMIGRSGLFIFNSLLFYEEDNMKIYNNEFFDKLLFLSQNLDTDEQH